MTPEDVPLRRYLVALRAHGRLVVACGLVAVITAGFVVSRHDPTYTATTRLLVTPVSDEDLLGLPLLRDVGDDSRTMQTAAAVVDTSDIAAAAASDLGEGWTVRTVRRRVSIRPHGQSNVLDVTARGATRAEAVALADAYAQAIIDTRQTELNEVANEAIAGIASQLADADLAPTAALELRDRLRWLQPLRDRPDPTISLVEGGQAASSPLGASATTTIALAVAAGLIVGAIVANVLDALRGRPAVLQESELTEIVPGPVLARVELPHRWRSRGNSHHPALDDLALRYALDGPRAVLVTGSSPSADPAACAVELAKGVTRMGCSVALIDAGGELDHLCAPFGINSGATTLSSGSGSAPDVQALMAPGTVDLQVLVATGDSRIAPTRAMERLMAAARPGGARPAHLAIAVAPSISGVVSAAAAAAADEVVVVSRLGSVAADDLRRAATLIDLIGTPIAGHVIAKRTALLAPTS